MGVTYGKITQNEVNEADTCILTGRPVNESNSVRETIAGTPFFYRVLSSQYHRVTEEARDAWRKAAPKLAAPVRSSSSNKED